METLLATPAVGAIVALGSGRLYTRPAFGTALVLILYLLNAAWFLR